MEMSGEWYIMVMKVNQISVLNFQWQENDNFELNTKTMKQASYLVLLGFIICTFSLCKKDSTPAPCEFVDIRDGLVAYYPFNGNSNDESGNNNHANPKGGIQLSTDRSGNPNKAYIFDGVDDYLDLPSNPSLTPVRLSVVLWFNMDNNGKMQLIGNNDNADGYPAVYATSLNYFSPGAHIAIRKPGTCDINNDAGYDPVVKADFTFTPGKWYCYAVTYDGLKVRIFVDGVIIKEQATAVTSIAQCTGTIFKIGRWWNNEPLYFKGKMDEIRVYNRGLSVDEVKLLSATCYNK